MERKTLPFCLILGLLIREGRLAGNCPGCQQVCAFTNTFLRSSCITLEINCETGKQIKVLNAVCGARNKLFDYSCLVYSNFKCSERNLCCQLQTGDQRWPMASYHGEILHRKCFGKQRCEFQAPIDEFTHYSTHYCYVLYQCFVASEHTPPPTLSATTIQTTCNNTPVLLSDPTESVSSKTKNAGLSGGGQTSVFTYSTTESSDSSRPFNYWAVISSMVLVIAGLLTGTAFWMWKRHSQKQITEGTMPADMDDTDQRETQRASNAYEFLSPVSNPVFDCRFQETLRDGPNKNMNPEQYDDDNTYDTCKDTSLHFTHTGTKKTHSRNDPKPNPKKRVPITATVVLATGSKVEGCREERTDEGDFVSEHNEIISKDMDDNLPLYRTNDFTRNTNTVVTDTDGENYINLVIDDKKAKLPASNDIEIHMHLSNVGENEAVGTGTTEYLELEPEDHYSEIDPEYICSIRSETMNSTIKPSGLKSRIKDTCLSYSENNANDTETDAYFKHKAGKRNDIASGDYYLTETTRNTTQATTLNDRKSDISLCAIGDKSEFSDAETAEYFVLEADEYRNAFGIDDYCLKRDKTEQNDQAGRILKEQNIDKVRDSKYNATNFKLRTASLLDRGAAAPSSTVGANVGYYSSLPSKDDAFNHTTLNVRMPVTQTETNGIETNEYFRLELQETDPNDVHLCAEPSTSDSEYNRILFRDKTVDFLPTYHSLNKTAIIGDTVGDTSDYSTINNNVIHASNEYSNVCIAREN